MATVIMALVDQNGNVVNKIAVDTEKPYTPPKGYSMHEWTEADEIAFNQYLNSLKGNFP